jgi:Ribosome recycling factor
MQSHVYNNDEFGMLSANMQERRKEMAKTVSKLSEDGKVAIRNVRRDALKQVRHQDLRRHGCTAVAPCRSVEATLMQAVSC